MNVPPAEPGAEEVIARNPLLAFVLCRQEAFHRTAQEFRRRELECDTLPYLRHLGEIWPEDSAPGTPERVDFAKPLRKFAKARLPDYRLSIRDLTLSKALNADVEIRLVFNRSGRSGLGKKFDVHLSCLLYTSDAADERSSVDLGG